MSDIQPNNNFKVGDRVYIQKYVKDENGSWKFDKVYGTIISLDPPQGLFRVPIEVKFDNGTTDKVYPSKLRFA